MCVLEVLSSCSLFKWLCFILVIFQEVSLLLRLLLRLCVLLIMLPILENWLPRQFEITFLFLP